MSGLDYWRHAKLGGGAKYSTWVPKRPPTETLKLIAQAAWDLNRWLPDDVDGGLVEQFEELESILSEHVGRWAR